MYTDGHSSKSRTCSECGSPISSGSKKGKCSLCYTSTLFGEQNPNFRFGHYFGDLLSTKEYKNWRTSVYRRDGFRCVICEESHTLEAHHILPKRRNPELVLDVNNGISLCKRHHEDTFGKEEFFENKFKSIIKAELKLCETVNPEIGNTVPSQFILEGVTTRDEINFPTSAGQPLQA